MDGGRSGVAIGFAMALALGCGNPGDDGFAIDTDGQSAGEAEASGAATDGGPGDPDDDDDSPPASSSGDDETTAGASDTEGEPDDGGDETTGEGDEDRMDLCFMDPPAGADAPPAPPSYSGGSCPDLSAGYVTGFSSNGRNREFALILPDDYDASKSYPVVFAWYHLSGDAQSFVNEIGAQMLASRYDTIFVVPQATGDFQFVWPSTPLDNGSAGVDLGFFDDIYACITEQFSVNTSCVSSLGVSAGGLWTSFLGQRRGQYLSTNLVASGGYPTEYGGYWWDWQTSPHRFASLVLWGGPSDQLGIDFHSASLNYLQHIRDDDHFVVRCEHGGGHGLPTNIDPNDPASFDSLFHFMLNNPYWTGSDSPLLDTGLPDDYPDFCSIP